MPGPIEPNKIEFEYRQYDDPTVILQEKDIDAKLRACKDEPNFVAQSKDGSIAYVQHNGIPKIKNGKPKTLEDRVVCNFLSPMLVGSLSKQDIDKALINTYANLQDLVKTTNQGEDSAGAACGTGLIIGDTYYGAALGDPNLFVGIFDEKGNCNSFERLNKLHNLDTNAKGEIENNEERERVQLGKKPNEPRIVRLKDSSGYYYRLKKPNSKAGSLGVTRAFGDEKYEAAGLSHEPELVAKKLDIPAGGFALIVTTCDGLTEHDKDFQVLKEKLMASAQKAPGKIAQELNEFAFNGYYKKGDKEKTKSFDNLSNVVYKKFASKEHVSQLPIHVSVIDGHGGPKVAETLRQNFEPELQKAIKKCWIEKYQTLSGLQNTRMPTFLDYLNKLYAEIAGENQNDTTTVTTSLVKLLIELGSECDKLAANSANYDNKELFAPIDSKLQEIYVKIDSFLSKEEKQNLDASRAAYLLPLNDVLKQIYKQSNIYGKSVDIFAKGMPFKFRESKFAKEKFMIWQLSQDDSLQQFLDYCQKLGMKADINGRAIQILTDKITALSEIKQLKETEDFQESEQKRSELYGRLKSLSSSERAELTDELGIDIKTLTKWCGFSTKDYPVTFANLGQRYEVQLEQEKHSIDFHAYLRKGGIALLGGGLLFITVVAPLVAALYAIFCGYKMLSSWSKHEKACALETEITNAIELQLKTPLMSLVPTNSITSNDNVRQIAHTVVTNATPRKRNSQSDGEVSHDSDDEILTQVEKNITLTSKIPEKFVENKNDEFVLQYPSHTSQTIK